MDWHSCNLMHCNPYFSLCQMLRLFSYLHMPNPMKLLWGQQSCIITTRQHGKLSLPPWSSLPALLIALPAGWIPTCPWWHRGCCICSKGSSRPVQITGRSWWASSLWSKRCCCPCLQGIVGYKNSIVASSCSARTGKARCYFCAASSLPTHLPQ